MKSGFALSLWFQTFPEDSCDIYKWSMILQERNQNETHLTPDRFYCTSSSSEARQRHITEIDPAEADWV